MFYVYIVIEHKRISLFYLHIITSVSDSTFFRYILLYACFNMEGQKATLELSQDALTATHKW